MSTDQLAGPAVKPVLEARHLTRHFVVKGQLRRTGLGSRVVHAVDDVSLALVPGQVVAVVGESGSGKSTVGRLLARLDVPTSGDVVLRGSEVRRRGSRALRPYRRQVQIIFQDPFASLNPLHTVGYHIGRPLRIHGLASTDADTRAQVEQLLERVQLTPPGQFAAKLPHELSGGQRQRVAIARALAVRPSVLIADEPISMLDVSIRLSVLNLLADLARRESMAMLYITHDIASARYFADTVLVMYAGRIVEGGPAEQVTQYPAHPYTRLLLSAAPNPEFTGQRQRTARGEPPSLITPPPGCRFHPRCPQAMPVCSQQLPEPIALGGDQWAACWLHASPTDAHPASSVPSAGHQVGEPDPADHSTRSEES
jgi:peptide/nickel transport system ATP-binding protein